MAENASDRNSVTSTVMQHPLNIVDDEDADICDSNGLFRLNSSTTVHYRVKSPSNDATLTNIPQVPTRLSTNSNTSIESTMPDINAPPKPPKRIAPKRPDPPPLSSNSTSNESISVQIPKTINTQESQSVNYFIEMDQVRWFFKEDKDKDKEKEQPHSLSHNVNYFNSISTPNLANLNNNNNNQIDMDPTQGVHATTLNKWHKFSKIDSKNLEVAYRDMLTNKTSNELPRLVQVKENLYEVNLQTRKCYAIYWKCKNGFLICINRKNSFH
jgi:hypothetical protein